MAEQEIKVSIRCATYNHEKYIRRCLEGFVMQKTNFRFEAIVHDDASTDGTRNVIKEYAQKYPDFIKPIYETENLYSKQDGRLEHILNNACVGKYVATCEGDDFWTDPYKLQKQVDFLEEHRDYTLVHTGFKLVDLDDNLLDVTKYPFYDNLKTKKKTGHLWHEHLIHGTPIMYCTCLFRNNLLEKKQSGLDHGIFMTCARKGKVHYINEETTCYRINPEGTMRSRHNFVIFEIRKAIYEQLCLFSNPGVKTLLYYRVNPRSRVMVAEAILNALLSVHKQYVSKRLFCLILMVLNPVNLVFLPFGAIAKMLNRIYRI